MKNMFLSNFDYKFVINFRFLNGRKTFINVFLLKIFLFFS